MKNRKDNADRIDENKEIITDEIDENWLPIIESFDIQPTKEDTEKKGGVLLLMSLSYHDKMENKKSQDAQDFFDELLKDWNLSYEWYSQAKKQIRSNKMTVTVDLADWRKMIYDKAKER